MFYQLSGRPSAQPSWHIKLPIILTSSWGQPGAQEAVAAPSGACAKEPPLTAVAAVTETFLSPVLDVGGWAMSSVEQEPLATSEPALQEGLSLHSRCSRNGMGLGEQIT